MISVAAFKSVRARLLALMALIVIPIAALSVILATTTYRSVIASVEAAQIETASNYAVRTRIWFRGVLRTLAGTASSLDSIGATDEVCGRIANRLVADVEGFEAVRFRFNDGVLCHAAGAGGPDAAAMDRLLDGQRGLAPDRVWAGQRLADARYDATVIGERRFLMVYARDEKSDKRWEAVLLISPELLRQAFQIGTLERGHMIALVKRGGDVLVVRGAEQPQPTWLPVEEVLTPSINHWEAVARDGTQGTFAAQTVAEPDLYVLARFADQALLAARTQFALLVLTPLATLSLLFLTYARVIQSNIIRWITGIEAAARRRRTDPHADVLAPVDGAMPADIRSVAEALNEMVSTANRREQALKQSLDANHYLMRELHHRVKNSLQVIQSYLSLSRRMQPPGAAHHLAETEAKVQVLSVAYRLALTDGGMRPVPVDTFADEILANLSSSLRHAGQWLDVTIDVEAGLIVDRIIPFGLALVESVVAGFNATGATRITATIKTIDDGRIELCVSTDGTRLPNTPSPKIVAGLAAQLEADVQDSRDNEVIRWIFSA